MKATCLLLVGAITVLVVGAFQHHVAAPRRRQSFDSRTTTQILSSLTSTIDVTEGAPRDIVSIGQWATNCGVQTCDGFQILQTKDEDGLDNTHVITNQDLPRDNPILYVPNELIFTGHKARQELGNGAFDAEQMLAGFYGQEQISQFYLFLKLLREYELGEASPWYYYLNSLPRFFSNGSSMTDFCYGCLPPYAAGLALAEKTRMKLYIQALEDVSFLQKESKVNDDLTKWAFAVANTRCVELPNGDFGIVPMADFFNHGGLYDVNAYTSFDEQGNCYAYSTQDVPAGYPLLISYGDSTNPSKLLARYGFLDESSPATYCKYMIDGPDNAMKEMGYPEKMLFYTDGGISTEVWDIVLYEQLDKINSPKKHQLYQAVMSGDEATKQSLHQENFFLTVRALQKHVDFLVNELDELVSTLIDFGRDD
jgi:hypothetical protein